MKQRIRRHGMWTFFRQWLKSPLRTAAVAPSGQELAEAVVAALPAGARRVIELGGGTGALTRSLLSHGINGRGLLVIELNQALHAHLHRRFPLVHIELGDARQLREIVRRDGYFERGPADAVVSGLGLLAMPREHQREILEAAFDCIREGGRFIQFTYGPQPPVAADVVEQVGLRVRKGAFVLRNVPPATVYIYERMAGQNADLTS